MSTATALSWSCPQCRRRVPRRERVCHCGFARSGEPLPLPEPPAPAAEPRHSEEAARGVVLVAAAVVGALVVGVGAIVLREVRRTGLEPRHGSARYPALPALVERPLPAPATRRAVLAPNFADTLDLDLRRIAADTSELEMRYRPFAQACVAGAADAAWPVALKTAKVRADVVVLDHGAMVGCDKVRWPLLERADALKAELEATASRARTDGMLPGRWRAMLARYDLGVWDRY